MPVIKIPTTYNIEVEFEVPEFYRRLVALLIDILIQYFYLRLAGELFTSMMRNTGYGSDARYNMQAVALLLLLPIFLYHVLMEVTLNGQSVGKKIMGMRVVNENGGRASISQFIIRWLLRVSDTWIASIFIFLIFYGFSGHDAETTFIIVAALLFIIADIALVVSSKKGQRIGDMLAKTILIRTSQKANIEETVFQEVADDYVPSFPQIMRLSDKDLNAINNILETARKKGDYNMAFNAAEKIKAHLQISSDLSPFDFLAVLLKDYNYLSVK